jgi:hypothetical protein
MIRCWNKLLRRTEGAANFKKEAEVDRQLKQSNDTNDNENAFEE